ncbi:MAG: PAS domain S-box protein, partial [Desulfarculus sp.]|nr:PAS domain S-box protein [Desulfarculus sp.]
MAALIRGVSLVTKHPWTKNHRRHWKLGVKSRSRPRPRTAANKEATLDYQEIFEALLHGHPLGRAVLGVIPDPVVVYDHQGAVVYFNPAFTKTFGWELDELLGQQVPFVPEAERGVSLAAIQHLFASGGSGVFNSRRLTKDGRLLDVRISATGIVDAQGAVVGMVVNLTDQTAIKNAERELGRHSAFFEQLFHASPDAILVVEHGGEIQRVNQEFTRLFGYQEQEVKGLNATDLLAPGELRAEGLRVRERIKRGESIRIETRRQAKDGWLVDVDLSATPIILDQHRLGDLVVYRDITAHKAAEAALAQSEERYRTLFESAGDAIFLIEDDRFVACNNQACDLLGAGREKIIGAHPWDFSPPEQTPGISSQQYGRGLMAAVLRGDAQLFEWKHRRLDGSEFDAEVRMTRVAVAGKPLVMTLVRDITERRRALAALKQSEDKFAKAFMASPTWVTIAAADDGRFLDVNQAFLAGTLFSRPEVIGRSALDIKLWANPAQREQMVQLLRRDGRIRGEQVTFRRRDGELVHCELSVELIEVEGRPCFLAVMVDVTERKRAEAELELIHFTLNHAPAAAYLIRSDGSFAYVNQTACDRLGYTRQELLGLRVRDLDPVYTEQNRLALWKNLRIRRHIRLESTHRAKNGEVFPVEVRVNHLEWGGEEYHCVFVSDISESRQAQQALAESEERFRVLSEESPLGVSLISADGKSYEYVNPAFTAIFGYTLEEVRKSGQWARLVFPDPALRRQVLADWLQDKAGVRAKQSRVRTYEVVCKDGSRKTILFRPVLTSSGRDFVLYEDITQQVRFEKALRESERRYRELVDNISDFIYTHDLDGRFLSVNRMAAASLGYAPEDLIGRRITDLMLPEHRRDFHQQYL